METKTYFLITGTRPEIIKMAPVYKALKNHGGRPIVVHTGQHDSMAHSLYKFFDMTPDFSIDLKRKSGALAHLSSAVMDGMEEVLNGRNCDTILVQGDTTSALIGAMCGFYHGIPIGHVEAGLRTHEKDPFPEEKNREIIGRLAQWHFVPTDQAYKNLIGEGIPEREIHMVGNTVIDAALDAREKIIKPGYNCSEFYPEAAREILSDESEKRIILITAHRRENWGQPIRNIATAVGEIVARFDTVVAIWPLHPNPSVMADVKSVLSTLPGAVQRRIVLTAPLEYPAVINLLARCEFTLTDSGGIQEEASAFSKPVLVARESTERQELISAGGGRLVGTNVDTIISSASELLTDETLYDRMRLSKCPFGDGQTAQRIADILMT